MCGKAVHCGQCDKWCHVGERCGNIKPVDYQKFMKDASNSLKWYCPMCMNTQGCIRDDGPRPKSTRQRSQGLANRQNEGETCEEDKDHTANLKEKLIPNKSNMSVAHINMFTRNGRNKELPLIYSKSGYFDHHRNTFRSKY